jgi:large subunit ribosomal protein L29
MDIDEIRKLSDKDLSQRIYDLKGELMTLRFQQSTGNLDNGAKLHDCRKSIAKCLTVQKERQIAAEKAGAVKKTASAK